jgi:type IV pilus assembly protein PilA
MKTEFKAKFIRHLMQRKKNEGFTLIELLVVVIIIGVLAAVALPNLLSQVGKARESEGKNAVGTINRAQQSYHFERQVFAADEPQLGVSVTTNYYGLTITPNKGVDATVAADASSAEQDGLRNYAGGIAFDAGQYSTVVCQSETVGGAATSNAAGGKCGDGILLR